MGDQDPGSDEGTDFLLSNEASATGGHPAWQEILDAIPEDYRAAVMPTLEKWDSGVQKRFQSLHSTYEPIKKFKDYDPNELEMGLNLIQRINEDPRAVWELMGQTYDFAVEQGATENEGNMSEQYEEASVGTDPAILQQLAELQEAQARIEQEREMQQYQEQLDAYMTYLHEEHGDFDDDYVVTLLANGVDGPEAVTRYNKIVESAAAKNAPVSAPRIMPSGGGVPSNAIDPVALNNSQTKDLVAQMLEQAARGE